MNIKTEQDMKDFCKQVNGPFRIEISTYCFEKENLWNGTNKKMIELGKIGKGSHLQQGIQDINFSKGFSKDALIDILEKPFLYPSGKILNENMDLTGAITGSLSNCYDPLTKNFLFHMRGVDISVPFGFQAGAAGMGVYGQNPGLTAAIELYEETGLTKFRQLFHGQAVDILPFMKGGPDGVPQPLFSFAFSDDLSNFTSLSSLEEIAEFEESTKKGLKEQRIKQKEAYNFTIPYKNVEKITGEINDSRKFYGPIYESTINFIKSLKDYGMLN